MPNLPTRASLHAPRKPKRNLAREIHRKLRAEILSGNIIPGAALAEPVLARKFKSSRAPIREALIELEREGLVQFQTTGRTRVITLSSEDLDEILEARIALESMAARRAALRWSPQDTALLEENIRQQSKASTLSELSRLDIELHQHVMERSGNRRLLALWQNVRAQFEMSLASAHRHQQKFDFKPRQITVDSHRRLLAALASRKPELAARSMAAHIESILEWDPIGYVPPANAIPTPNGFHSLAP